ncbi:arf-GAP with Rho-GAP domain, ANK repeat and PH domain-containing protein 2 isoform X2 [Thalassophryne amazonica]|uniref:arf-GAP with Rho-GAP domain, ANK repeat and PH domain-containing protein 2 isoform X2 n=1 Tax=Thalassophryne amazonica TaxID=390379 RepID=UPI001470F763|nr:arf-GAP with Rho-GAP domain, ANK repeat and PH domain-containing protein 2 isoform X2 [Thalassophryne amazonica]
MSEPPEPSEEFLDWLATLRLPQYTQSFRDGGYQTLEDCKDLTDERLLELKVLPTGHRRRILRSLEALGVTQQNGGEDDENAQMDNRKDRRKPMLHPRHIFMHDRKRGISVREHWVSERVEDDLEGSLTLPPGAFMGKEIYQESRGLTAPQPAPRKPENVGLFPPASELKTSKMISSSSSSSDSLSVSEMPSDWEISSEDAPFFIADSAEAPKPVLIEDNMGFQGEMVENSIYEEHPTTQPAKGPRLTRSYRLRHRPVPEIPNPVVPPLLDRSTSLGQTTIPEPLSSSDGPTGANGAQKATLQRSLAPIAPYGETFLYNNPDSISDRGTKDLLQKRLKDKIKHKKLKKKSPKHKELPRESDKSMEKPSPLATNTPKFDIDEYSTVDECASILPPATRDQNHSFSPETVPVGATVPSSVSEGGPFITVECDLYSNCAETRGHAAVNTDISPYACFYGGPKHQLIKSGWLDKLSPQGNCVFQRRWVRFDGESLAYYNNDKDMYSKGMILASAIRQVRGLGDNKFEVVTSLRTFVFRTEREGERQEWMETLQTASSPPPCGFQKCSASLARPSSANKRGLLELRGYKGRVLASLAGSKVRLCKTEQDYKAGLAIAEIELTAANIKDLDRCGFEINTPFKNFCFTAESEREKEEWVEAIQESITETLCNYEVVEKIWYNEANRICADCCAPQPEWASVNLGVVICKMCAGQHRSLGPSISKVRSLKLDSSIWSNELVELFLEVGNNNANSFWAANLPFEEELYSGASAEQRATFIRRKYRERKYSKILEEFQDLEQLNQVLCAAVVLPDVLQTMALVFSGADVMCATGDPIYSTPYFLAQSAGQKLQMEFLHQNKLSDFPRLEQWSENTSMSSSSPFMDGFLYISCSPAKSMLDRHGRDDMARHWCTLEGGFLSYYESERSPSAIGRVDITEVVSLAISNTEMMTSAGAMFTIELYLQSEKVLVVGAETQDTQRDWIRALAKCFVPAKVEELLQRDGELIGRLRYKEGHDLYRWRMGWFVLEGSTLHFSSGEDEEEEVMQLKQLQELTVSTHAEGEAKIHVLLMVEGGRTVYIRGVNKIDFALWHSAIRQAAGTDGNALSDQQLTKNCVPIIVDSCIAFVTQYGLCQEGVYQKAGDTSRVAALLEEFTRDARNVKLREKEHQLEDVTDTLKSFLSKAEDALLTKELYPYWVSALDEKDERLRVKKYSTFIESLPKINKSTLEALLQHLYRIQQCSQHNQMPSDKLASVFSSCLFQTRGQTSQEVTVISDLINNYVTLFSFSPAGDLIFEVYVEKREPESCCLIKVSPSMRSMELAEIALGMKNITFNTDDWWTTFEVIENGELERPLHHKEKVLEQVLTWSTLENPSAAFLVVKKFAELRRAANEKAQKDFSKSETLKFNDGSTKLLSGHKFQDRYVILGPEKLVLYRDIKSTRAEKILQLKSIKCYFGLKKKLKPPTSWGFNSLRRQTTWHFCCDKREAQISWLTDIIRMKYGSDFWPENVQEVPKTSRGGAVNKGQKSPQNNQNSGKQLTDWRTSVSDGDPAAVKDSGVNHRTPSATSDLLRTPELAHRQSSGDVCQPLYRLSPSPSPSRHSQPLALPAASQGALKGLGRRPVVSGQGQMPCNLLNELNSVLSKTGRSAKKND